MTKIQKLLSFINLLDRDGNLSITNLAVVITLIKLTIAPSPSLAEAGTLLIALSNYAHKRTVIKDAQESVPEDLITPQIEELKSKLDETQSKVSAMALQAGMKTSR